MKREYIVEILIIILASLLLVGLIAYSIKKNVYDKNLYTLYFRDVDGIIPGSPVKFMGVTVGHVSKLTLKGNKIKANIFVSKPGIKIPDCANARVEFSGIVGSKYIEITPPDGSGKCGGIIANDPLRISVVVEILDIYNRAFKGLENGIKKFSGNDTQYLMQEVRKKTGDFSELDKTMNKIPEIQNKMDKTTQDIVEFGKNASRKADELNEKINPKNKAKN
ncbi:MCE family protein [bacterium]|nr:MCE family protein [bacterium]